MKNIVIFAVKEYYLLYNKNSNNSVTYVTPLYIYKYIYLIQKLLLVYCYFEYIILLLFIRFYI